jgi:Protein of unknown function (DUF3467)
MNTAAIQQVEKIDATQSAQFVSVYSNYVQVNSNFFDTTMIFGEMTGIKDGVLSVEQKVRVVMSLPQVKLFALTLFQQISAYEHRFGPVHLAPEIVPSELADFQKRFESVERT